MSGIATVYAVFGSAEEAEEIGRAMIEQRLAACVNILPACRSLFRWNGEVVVETEVPTIFKTGAEQAQALVEAIGALHSYEVPAICVWPIDKANSAYVDWVKAEIGG